MSARAYIYRIDYFSSYADTWLEHCRNYVNLIIRQFNLDQNSFVVELASNDGYLLQYFVQKNIPVLGIEPAKNVARVAIEKGVPMLTEFFGKGLALRLTSEGKQADLIAGNNVLAQVPNINDFVTGIKILLKSDGVVTIEFPHLMRLMAENQFDTMYHEHFSYFSFITAEKIFAAHGLMVFDVDELPTHGGSLRIYARHAEDDTKPVTERAVELHDREIDAGFTNLEHYSAFGEQVKETKRKLLSFLIEAKRNKKSIAGYGAPGKGNTMLNYCGVRIDFLDYTVDRNPYKHGKFLSGTHIPIFSPEKIRETKPDYVLILPWNFKDEIMNQVAYIREWGGHCCGCPGVEGLSMNAGNDLNMKNLFDGAFDGLTVLLTGHTGFKGSWLTLWLREMGAVVIGYSLDEPPTTPSNYELSRAGRGITDIRGDVRDYDRLKQVIEQHQPELVIHFAEPYAQ